MKSIQTFNELRNKGLTPDKAKEEMKQMDDGKQGLLDGNGQVRRGDGSRIATHTIDASDACCDDNRTGDRKFVGRTFDVTYEDSKVDVDPKKFE